MKLDYTLQDSRYFNLILRFNNVSLKQDTK